MIALRRFFWGAIRENVAPVHAYESGGDGSNGKCDCIGLIIGAVRLACEAWGESREQLGGQERYAGYGVYQQQDGSYNP